MSNFSKEYTTIEEGTGVTIAASFGQSRYNAAAEEQAVLPIGMGGHCSPTTPAQPYIEHFDYTSRPASLQPRAADLPMIPLQAKAAASPATTTPINDTSNTDPGVM